MNIGQYKKGKPKDKKKKKPRNDDVYFIIVKDAIHNEYLIEYSK